MIWSLKQHSSPIKGLGAGGINAWALSLTRMGQVELTGWQNFWPYMSVKALPHQSHCTPEKIALKKDPNDLTYFNGTWIPKKNPSDF